MNAPSLVAFICGRGDTGLWTFDLWITAPLLGSGALYGIGIGRLWQRAGIGRGSRPRHIACYAAGWAILVLALVSPIHRWGTGLFSIHMLEHELVMAAAAPLLVLGRAGGAFAWSLPRAWVHGLRRSPLYRAWQFGTRPVTATIVHGAAIWVWHIPPLFDAAVVDPTLHRLQHISFLLTGLLFWRALLCGRKPGIAAAHLFATMLHTSILGAIIALAPHVLYRLQTDGAGQWGFTALQDQQLAGLIMWIPAGLIYAAAAMLCFACWIRRSGAAIPELSGTSPVYDAVR